MAWNKSLIFTNASLPVTQHYCWFISNCCIFVLNINNNLTHRWFVNTGSDSPEISLLRTKTTGTAFRFRTDGWFSNPENSLIRKYRPGTNVCGLTNHHCNQKRYTQGNSMYWISCMVTSMYWISSILKMLSTTKQNMHSVKILLRQHAMHPSTDEIISTMCAISKCLKTFNNSQNVESSYV